MHIRHLPVVLIGWLLVSATMAFAQYPVISAEEVAAWSRKHAVIIDSRTQEEYRAGHIPGAINMPAERMMRESSRLPKSKSTPLIFYCRGAG